MGVARTSTSGPPTTGSTSPGGALLSIGLDGHDEREHLSGQFVSDIRVSPDERWVTWSSRFHAYLRPFIPTGSNGEREPREAGTSRSVRVTQDAGDFLHWSGDGERLHWALGPELFTLEWPRPSTGPTRSGDEIDLPVPEGHQYRLPPAADRPTGRRLRGRADHHHEWGRGHRERDPRGGGQPDRRGGAGGRGGGPGRGPPVDASGHTIMPGLVDVHQHGGQGSGPIIPRQNRSNYATLAFGVTTIHNPSANTQQIFAASEMARPARSWPPGSSPPAPSSTGLPRGARPGGQPGRRPHAHQPPQVGGGLQREELQPAPPGPASADPRGRAGAGCPGGARGGRALPAQHEHGPGRPHRDRALPPPRAVYDDVLQFWGGSGTGYTPTLVVSFGRTTERTTSTTTTMSGRTSASRPSTRP
jgi:hypothetical protein